GQGSFKAEEGTNPYVGTIGSRHYEEELRLEMVYPSVVERQVLIALFEHHPYEEIAYDLFNIENSYDQVGAGMIGRLSESMAELDFLALVKEKLQAKVIRHTQLRNKRVERVAVCGGSGSFLLSQAIRQGADMFITADYKYHE